MSGPSPKGPTDTGLEQIERLLEVDSVDEAAEATAGLVFKVMGAKGARVLQQQGDELQEICMVGKSTTSGDRPNVLAGRVLKTGRAARDGMLLAAPLLLGDTVGVVIVEDPRKPLDADLTTFLSSLGSAAFARQLVASPSTGADDGRCLELSRFVSPSLSSALARDAHEGLFVPETRAVSLLVLLVHGLPEQFDLVGAERILPIVQQYFATVVDTIYEHEGVPTDLGLDRLTAVFGAPVATDAVTQADLAAASGLQLLSRFQSIAESWGIEGMPVHMHARLGVSTGNVMVGSMGSPDRPVFTAIGALVTLATKLAEQGEPGELIVDSSTRSLLAERLTTRSVGAVEVGGLDYPVFAYAAERC